MNTYSLEFKRLASSDTKTAYHCYGLQKENLEEFHNELVQVDGKIQQHPAWFPKRESDCYFVFMERFPYEIIYRLSISAILAVYHEKRNQ